MTTDITMLLFTSPTKWTVVEGLLVAAVCGIASHLCFFIYGEHHMKAPVLFRLYGVLFSAVLYFETAVKPQGKYPGTRKTFEIFAVYTLSLLTSIIIYRKIFHRLRHFPGPFMASVTKIWQTTKTLDSQNHLLLDRLYEEYGDLVRTGKRIQFSADCVLTRSKGPAEITIFTPKVKCAVDGPTNQCNKAVWYDILLPMIALNTTRSKKERDQRRRIWDRAFTLKGLAPPSQC